MIAVFLLVSREMELNDRKCGSKNEKDEVLIVDAVWYKSSVTDMQINQTWWEVQLFVVTIIARSGSEQRLGAGDMSERKSRV